MSLPFFPCTSFLFLLLEESNWWKEVAKDEDVFEDLKFLRQSSVSRWARYESVPGPGRVSISVSMPACHAGELGSIPRRGGEIATPPAPGWSPIFGKNFWICNEIPFPCLCTLWWGENIKKKIYQKKKDCLGYSYTFIGEQDRSSLWGLTAWAIVSMTVIYAARCGKRVW